MATARRVLRLPFGTATLLLLLLAGGAAADDASSNDDAGAPSTPGCSNKFQLLSLQVKVKHWVNGTEGPTIVGLSARFGAPLPREMPEAQKSFAVLANPLDCCSNLTSKLRNFVALATRGECAFTTKAKIAQASGAVGLLVINDNEGRPLSLRVGMLESRLFGAASSQPPFPYVALPFTAPSSALSTTMAIPTMNKKIFLFSAVEIQLYSPNRPVVDLSACFLWIMAVGTIVCASLWSEFVACEQVDEHYNQLTRKAMHVCLVTLLARIFKDCGKRTVSLPILGEVLTLSVGIVPFCVVFAVLWAVYRHASLAWIGQDVLGICLMITVLQMARLPNIRVASALLSAAFVYDIFWVFISPLIFHESVMIALSSVLRIEHRLLLRSVGSLHPPLSVLCSLHDAVATPVVASPAAAAPPAPPIVAAVPLRLQSPPRLQLLRLPPPLRLQLLRLSPPPPSSL
nr:unnamed protein product [Digitaria exilis]